MPVVKVNAKHVIDAMNTWLDLNENFAPFFIEILGKQNDQRQWTLRGSALKSFSTKTSPFSEGGKVGGWKPLNSKYQEQKAKKYAGMPMLVASGSLFNSVVRSNAHSVVIMSKKKLSFGTNLPYAKYLQMGTSKMPARSFLGFNKEQKESIEKLLVAYMQAAMKGKQEALKKIKSGIKEGK